MDNDPPPPITGDQLLDWIYTQPEPEKVYRAAKALGRRFGCPVPFHAWNTTDIVAVYHALNPRAAPRMPRGAAGPVSPPSS